MQVYRPSECNQRTKKKKFSMCLFDKNTDNNQSNKSYRFDLQIATELIYTCDIYLFIYLFGREHGRELTFYRCF